MRTPWSSCKRSRAWLALALVGGLLTGCAGAPIAQRAVIGDAAGVRRLLARGADPDGADYKQRRALELAVIKRRVDVVGILVDAGADVNHFGPYGKAPLHHAAARGPAESVRRLVRAGADLDARSRSGTTPLIEAALAGRVASAQALIAGGAALDLLSPQHGTALHVATRNGSHAIAQLLIEARARGDVMDARGTTARELARRLRRSRIVALLEMADGPAGAAPSEGGVRVASSHPLPGVAASPPPSWDPPSLRTHALVIGNDAYRELPRLRSAVRDARAVARLLEELYGYRVERLENATRQDVLAALRHYRNTLTERDDLLIYYAGHGWVDEEADRGYWLPVDASPANETHWIAHSAVSGALRAMEARHVLVVADSCFAGKLARGIRVVRGDAQSLEKRAGRRARTVLSSGGLEPVWDAGSRDGHSVFASAFLTALESNTGALSAQTLYERISRPVMLESDQTPIYADIRRAGHQGGDFVFLRAR